MKVVRRGGVAGTVEEDGCRHLQGVAACLQAFCMPGTPPPSYHQKIGTRKKNENKKGVLTIGLALELEQLVLALGAGEVQQLLLRRGERRHHRERVKVHRRRLRHGRVRICARLARKLGDLKKKKKIGKKTGLRG